MAIPGIKNLTQKAVTNTKNVNTGATTGSKSGKFSTALNEAENEDKSKEVLELAMENQKVIASRLTDPSSHPIEPNKDEG